MGDAESCSNRAWDSGWNHGRNDSLKVEVYKEILGRLGELNVPEVALPGFEHELWLHFYLLPTRYSIPLVLFLFICFVLEKRTPKKSCLFD